MKMFAAKILVLLAAVMLLNPPTAQAAPGPDLQVIKSCQVNPPTNAPPYVVICRVDVNNIGNVASVSPVTITDNPQGPPGTTFTGSPTSTFPCTTPTGGTPLPTTIACGAPLSLAPIGSSGAGGSTFLHFKLTQGGKFTNCATATQGKQAGTLPDPNLANNTKICTTIGVGSTLPPNLKTTKVCTKGANSSLTCTITVTNNGPGPSVSPLTLVDTISPVLPGTTLTGAGGNIACPGAGPYTAPITCQTPANAPSIPQGQSVVMLLSFKITGTGTFQNCAKVTQGGPVAETNMTDNTGCVKIAMP